MHNSQCIIHNGEIPRFPEAPSFCNRATRGKESVLMYNSQCIMHNGEMPHSVRHDGRGEEYGTERWCI